MHSVFSLAARRTRSPDYASTVRGRAGELKADGTRRLLCRCEFRLLRRAVRSVLMGIDSRRRSRLVTKSRAGIGGWLGAKVGIYEKCRM